MIESEKVNKVLLIDGNSFCYRAFYAIRSLSTSKGEPTNAVYGFISMLNKLISEHKPQHLAVAFDLKGPTFRHQRFGDYKAHRKPMPDELSVQIPVIKKVLEAYRIAIFEKAGYEADDIIATLTKRLAASKAQILIVTGDKDMLQIVSDNVKVLNPHKEDLFLTEGWVKQKFGVTPNRIVEIMALAGDTSDNIPGVPGIGEATAVDLIKRFGTLDQVLANTDKITNQARAAKIKEFAEQAKMSRELATLNSDVPQVAQKKALDLLRELKLTQADDKKLFKIFKELEFKSLMLKLMPENKDEIFCRAIRAADELNKFVKEVSRKKSVAVYFPGSDQEPMQAKISGAAFSLEEAKAFYLPGKDFPQEPLKEILEDKEIKKTGHNLKYAKLLLSNYGIDLRGIEFDTMIAAYLVNPEGARYSLSDLALEYLSSRLEGSAADQSEKDLVKMCCRNAEAVFRLSKILQRQLKGQGLLELFHDIEMPLVEVLADMEKEGVALDKDFLLHLSRDFEKKLKCLSGDIYEMAGESFNINSPKQLSPILFEKLKLPKIKRTKTGASTDTEVLTKLMRLHPIASKLLEFREISKLKSTYIDGLMKLLEPHTGKVHTSFNQAVTATGRLSSSRPNLQNIPIKTELGRRIRRAFVAGNKKNCLLSADYSQIELRMLAHLSGDKALIRAFKEDLDIHTYTASLIFGGGANKITAQMRNTAKTVNFGIIYGMSPFGLSKDLGIEQNKAQEFIEAYFRRYPGVKKFMARQIEKAKTSGFVTTLMKRRRYIPQIKSPDENIRQFAQRMAINAPVQGSASDLIKAAMREIYRGLKEQGLSAKMLLQVHDELVFSVPQQELEAARVLIKDKMENVVKLKVPVKVSIKSGKNWLEMK